MKAHVQGIAEKSTERRVAGDIGIVGVGFDGEPFDYRTWSGCSYYFFNSLKEKGLLYSAISAEPSSYTSYLYKLTSFNPNIAKWKFKYHINTKYYNEMTKVARSKINKLDGHRFNVILQTGAWYDLTGMKDKLTVSYNDGNFSTLLKSPYGYPRVNDRLIQKTFNYEKNIYDKLDCIFTMSRWLADSFISDYGVKSSKVIPVGAGINLPYIRPIENKSYDEKNILFIGKDFDRKGGRVLLEAFSRVRKEVRGATLTIIGSEPRDLPEGARSLGFISKSTKSGIDLLLEAYYKATVFVMPSLYEPFGVVFAEAMAHKLPCIGTSICAMPEIIDHERSGFVVPPGDAHLLAQRIIEILRDPKMCREMGENAFDKYGKNYTWETVTSKLVDAMRARK